MATGRTSGRKTKRRKPIRVPRHGSPAAAHDTDASVAGLKKKIALLSRELSQALEQRTASSEILRVISGSQADVQPVFDTIVASAARLCGARMGAVFRFDGELMHLGAMVNFAPGGEDTWRRLYPRPATQDTATGRAILEPPGWGGGSSWRLLAAQLLRARLRRARRAGDDGDRVLSSRSAIDSAAQVAAFRAALGEAGYVEGQNVAGAWY